MATFASVFDTAFPLVSPAGAPAFLPTSLANLALWLRSDLGISLSGSNVTDWADQSTVGDLARNMSQLTAGARPTLVATDATYNNRPTLSLDGGDFMASGTWSAAITGASTEYIVGSFAASGGTQFFDDGIDATNRRVTYGSAGALRAFAGLDVGAAATITSPMVVCTVFNGASSAIYRNNITTANSTGDFGSNNRTGLTLGGKYDGTLLMTGKMAEKIIYTGAHNAATRAQVMNYLAALYAITVAP